MIAYLFHAKGLAWRKCEDSDDLLRESFVFKSRRVTKCPQVCQQGECFCFDRHSNYMSHTLLHYTRSAEEIKNYFELYDIISYSVAHCSHF